MYGNAAVWAVAVGHICSLHLLAGFSDVSMVVSSYLSGCLPLLVSEVTSCADMFVVSC